MKKKLLNLLVIILLGLVWGTPVDAETDAIDVQPNVYEEQKIKIEQNVTSKDGQKKPLPEEQRNLTFEAPAASVDDRITDRLFLSPSSNETNTIIAKASQLNLFSEKEKKVQQAAAVPNQTETEGPSSLLLLMMAGLVLVIATMFFFIIPRFKQIRH